MDKLLNQFRRVYSDKGKGDVDFTEQEEKLRKSQNKLMQATQELVRASERLNDVAIGVEIFTKQLH